MPIRTKNAPRVQDEADLETDAKDPNAPRPDRNLVIEFLPRHIVERTDALNWTAKILVAVDSTRPMAKRATRWKTVGYYSSPASAFRRLLMLAADDLGPGEISVATYSDAIAENTEGLKQAVIYAERAHAITMVVSKFSDPKVVKTLTDEAKRLVELSNREASSHRSKLMGRTA